MSVLEIWLRDFPGRSIRLDRLLADDEGPDRLVALALDVVDSWRTHVAEPLACELTLVCEDDDGLRCGRPAADVFLLCVDSPPGNLAIAPAHAGAQRSTVPALHREALRGWLTAALAQDCTAGRPVIELLSVIAARARLQEPAELVRLQTYGGGRFDIPVVLTDGRRWVGGPIEGHPTQPPVALRLSHDMGRVCVEVTAHWSPWADDGAPGAVAIRTMVAELMMDGWSAEPGAVIADSAAPAPRRASAPAPDWISIPGGRFRIGLTDEEAEALAAELTRAAAELRAEEPVLGFDRFDASRAGAELREWLAAACPAHEIDVPGFSIQRLPVSNRQWLAFMSATGARRPVTWPRDSDPDLDRVLTGVTWSEAVAFARHLGADLPREAEWELAVRRDRRFFPWGDRYLPQGRIIEEAGLVPQPVGRRPELRSPWGVEDAVSALLDYCADELAPYPGQDRAWFDGHFPGWKALRVVRGGAPHQGVTCVGRSGIEPERRFKFARFRCVRRN